MKDKMEGIIRDSKGKKYKVKTGDKIKLMIIHNDKEIERELEIMDIRQKDDESAKIIIYQYKIKEKEK